MALQLLLNLLPGTIATPYTTAFAMSNPTHNQGMYESTLLHLVHVADLRVLFSLPRQPQRPTPKPSQPTKTKRNPPSTPKPQAPTPKAAQSIPLRPRSPSLLLREPRSLVRRSRRRGRMRRI
ncbi:uncharacterized protein EV422DRAFT_362327 [Fimicolochytrium jonesii]|uniref:uncharacterized protein n=1 Tax=Fimicolochytrium jonesii TaxID=1396493 RepID=UPI0022FE15F9|nr:uncharacterized protein EV422DRAFT_362327 [Fimicolochytrium jonesii]KAI8823615.1 hypothetical protein EV422DRAFT_362327 [Fimicolochytrium jonesii]